MAFQNGVALDFKIRRLEVRSLSMGKLAASSYDKESACKEDSDG